MQLHEYACTFEALHIVTYERIIDMKVLQNVMNGSPIPCGGKRRAGLHNYTQKCISIHCIQMRLGVWLCKLLGFGIEWICTIFIFK